MLLIAGAEISGLPPSGPEFAPVAELEPSPPPPKRFIVLTALRPADSSFEAYALCHCAI